MLIENNGVQIGIHYCGLSLMSCTVSSIDILQLGNKQQGQESCQQNIFMPSSVKDNDVQRYFEIKI